MALLEQFQTAFGTIRVSQSRRDGTLTYVQNGTYHSQANKDGASICVYIHVIFEIIRQLHGREVLIIGCGGGTLATMLRRLNCRVTVVDINPVAFTIARRYFKLPETVRCVGRDGIAYLRLSARKYDAVVIDVFGPNDTVPTAFTTLRFFKLLARRLKTGGVMVMNIITSHDADHRADIVARHAEAAGLPVTLFDWPAQQHRNTIVVGGPVARVSIPSGREAEWIKADLPGLVRRQPSRRLR